MKELKLAYGRVLSKQELKQIKGAEDAAQSTFESVTDIPCTITTYSKDGTVREVFTYKCSGSSAANQYCVDLIVTAGNGVYRCTYTCSYSSSQ